MELHKCVFLLHKYYFVGGYFYLVVFRVMKMAGEEGTLTKENFIKILRSSDLFLKAFDKNKDGIVTEVCNYILILIRFLPLLIHFFHFTTCHQLPSVCFHIPSEFGYTNFTMIMLADGVS